MQQGISKIRGVDWLTIALYLVLVGFGWMNIFATSVNPDAPLFLDPASEHFKQLTWIAISLLAFATIFLIDSKFFIEFSYLFYVVAAFLLILVIFIGIEVNAARAWFQFGPVRFQPVELAKVATALAFARHMSSFQFSFSNLNDVLKLALLWVVPVAVVIMQNDTGSALVFFAFFITFYREGMSPFILLFGFTVVMVVLLTLVVPLIYALVILALLFFAAVMVRRHTKEALLSLLLAGIVHGSIAFLFQARPNHLQAFVVSMLVVTGALVIFSTLKKLPGIKILIFLFWGAVVVAFTAGYFFDSVLSDYQRSRVHVLLGLKEDPLGAGFNVNQSKISIGAGGFAGTGFLQGTQTRFNFVPKQSTDFIFSTVGEEWGFIGTSLVVIVFLLLMYRIIILAERQRSTYSRVYGYSVASLIFFHFAVNIGMTIGLVPVIGIPLPFFSYGGSSLLGFTILLAIFLKLDTNRLQILR